MNPKHDETPAGGGSDEHGSPTRSPAVGWIWWPGVTIGLLTLVVMLPGAASSQQRLVIGCTTAIGFLLAGIPRLGPVVPLSTGVVVLGELVWFERFDDAPGAALATSIAAGAAALASLLLANRTRGMARQIDDTVAALGSLRRRNAVQEELLDSNELSQIDVDLSRSRRYQRPLSVQMIQIDNVELLERRLGADAVHAAQVELARVVNRHSRIADSRIAGSSSIVLGLPETEHDGARILAERIRLSFGARRIAGLDDVPLTVSIGIASYPIDGEHGEQVLRHARDALLDAIAEGGNRTRISDPLAREAPAES